MNQILVIGDVMLDEYISGDIQRISPEAPIPVLNHHHQEFRLGGAANLAANVKALGSPVQALGLFAQDFAGGEIQKLALAQGVHLSSILPAYQNPTTQKTRFLAAGQQVLRVDKEQVYQANFNDLEEGEAHLKSHLQTSEHVILSDYAKGALQESWLKVILNPQRTWKVYVDPKSSDWEKYRGADLLTPNFSEFQAAVMHTLSAEVHDASPLDNEHLSIRHLAEKLCEHYDIGSLLITRGAQGMSLWEHSSAQDIELHSQAREVFDVSGAGDTVLACVVQGLSSGLPLSEACVQANVAAGIAVAKRGTSVVTQAELQLALKSQNWHHKVIDFDAVIAQVKQARLQGQRVVFTNGCFDVIHRGHIQYLQESRELGDLLILGLNSDESVRRLKGESRPVNTQEDRAFVLANLQSVDWICVFDQDTPSELIQAIEPDVLVKGGDYSPEQVVGREWARQVQIVKFVEGYSSSNTLKKLEEQ